MKIHGCLSRFFWPGFLCVLLLCLCVLEGCGVASGQVPTAVTPTATAGKSVSMNVAAQQAQASPTSTSPSSTQPAPTLLPPGTSLPSEAQCAARVQRSSFEPRPQNAQANHSFPTAQQLAALASWGASMGQSSQADSLRKQLSGNFTGTTDEILQWVACKWGVEPDLVRAQAVIESYWRQSTQGDLTTNKSLCPPDMWTGKNCYQSYGILQIKYIYNKSAWPISRADTAFSAEYVYGLIRACYEGWTTYLSQLTPLPGYARYHAGDIWGCLGRWYSGNWYDQGAIDYIHKVQTVMAQKTWLQAGF